MSDEKEVRPGVPVVPGSPQRCKWDRQPLMVAGPNVNTVLVCLGCDFAEGGKYGPSTRNFRPQA